jgi:hypothetical protein
MCGLNLKLEAGNWCLTVDKAFNTDRLAEEATVKVIFPQKN